MMAPPLKISAQDGDVGYVLLENPSWIWGHHLYEWGTMNEAGYGLFMVVSPWAAIESIKLLL